MRVPVFEMDVAYRIKYGKLNGEAFFLGFGRGTPSGKIEAAFDVKLSNGASFRGGQSELVFLDDLNMMKNKRDIL